MQIVSRYADAEFGVLLLVSFDKRCLSGVFFSFSISLGILILSKTGT